MDQGSSLRDSTQSDPSSVASRNLFAPLTDLDLPVFDKFANNSIGVKFNGIGAYLDPKNQFVFPILRAESTTVSVVAEEGSISDVSGEQLTLVAGYQTRYNNRATVAGSLDMCSDAVMASSEENRQFCKQLINWVFQETGVLRASNLRHNKKGEQCKPATSLLECPNPENYKIEDHVEFFVDLE